jgi:hypothetical protein
MESVDDQKTARIQFDLKDIFALITIIATGLALISQSDPIMSIPFLVWLVCTFLHFRMAMDRRRRLRIVETWGTGAFCLCESAVNGVYFTVLIATIVYASLLVLLFLGILVMIVFY